MTGAVLAQMPRARPVARAERPVLNFWLFAAPYLVSIVYFFTMVDDPTHVVAPALPIVTVGVCALLAMIVERRAPQLNHAVAVMALGYAAVCLISIVVQQNNDEFAVRKLGLPLVGMAPAIFRFYVTPRQLLLFLVALAAVAYVYTTETSTLVSEGFFSTDSPNESILGVTFGAIAVWLVASNRWLLAAFAYAACLVFFKRNAILAAPLIAVVVLLVQIARPHGQARAMQKIVIVTTVLMALFAFYLSDFFDFVASHFVRGYNAEALSVGRAPIYDAILRDFDRSSVAEQLWGHGAGSVEHLVGNMRALHANLQLAHDEYLSWIYDFGVAGLIVLLFFFVRLGRTGAPAAAVLLFVATTMIAENYFLVSFNCLGVFMLFSTHVTAPARAPRR